MADILEPGKEDAYVAALRAAHQRWLSTNPAALDDPDGYHRLWPFQVSQNFGFTDQGLVVKYDSYLIAPHSSGQPDFLLPYGDLQGILQPAYMPASYHRYCSSLALVSWPPPAARPRTPANPGARRTTGRAQ